MVLARRHPGRRAWRNHLATSRRSQWAFRISRYVKGDSVRIEFLARHSQWVPAIARLLHQEWGDLSPWASLSEIETRLAGQLNIGAVPFTLVALNEKDDLIGTAGVKLFELPRHPDKEHWLGEVFVPVAERGRGVGSALTRACVAECERLQIPALYLYTPDQQSLYSRLGWEEIERSRANGESVSIMRLRLGG